MKGMPINLIILGGNVAKEPNGSFVSSGHYKLSFRMANNLFFSGKERTTFVNVTMWGERAQKVAERLRLGSSIIVEGRLQTYSYTNSEGNKINTFEIVANRITIALPEKSEAPPDDPPGVPDDDIPF